MANLSKIKRDEMIAFLSQLTHCIAVALMCANDATNLERYTGDSFRDLTRIARINDLMWSELFVANKEALLEQMELWSSSTLGQSILKGQKPTTIDELTNVLKVFKENGVGLITMYAGMLSEDEIEKESANLSKIMYNSIWTPELQAEYEAVSSIVNNANQKRSSSMNVGNVDQKGVRANVTYGYTYTPEEEAAIKRKAELEMIRSEAESKKAETDYYVTREWELAKYKDKYGKAWYDGEGELPDNKTISEIVKDVIKRNYEELSNLDAYNYGESTSAVATNYTNDELYKNGYAEV